MKNVIVNFEINSDQISAVTVEEVSADNGRLFQMIECGMKTVTGTNQFEENVKNVIDEIYCEDAKADAGVKWAEFKTKVNEVVGDNWDGNWVRVQGGEWGFETDYNVGLLITIL